MKYPVISLVIFTLLMMFSPQLMSQVRVDVKGKVKNEADNRANRATNRAIDAGFDKLEEGIKGAFKKKDKNSNDQAEEVRTDSLEAEENKSDANDDSGSRTAGSQIKPASPSLSWAKFDFLPGDAVIFEDNLQNEENGEFPSRWDLWRGNAEIAELDDEKVIMMRDGNPGIIPFFKDPTKDHLPDIFTIELDLLYKGEYPFDIFLYDIKNQQSTSPTGYTNVIVSGNEMRLGTATSEYPDKAKDPDIWRHISIAYTEGKLKAYLDDTRLINIPRLDFDPAGITLHAYHASDENHCYVKNVRIAKGGVKYYDRFMQDGKIIANGIRFDVNKATLKPESMGIINEIVTLMKEHPEINFSVEGHTDSDGDDAFNQTLSEQRAATVVNTLRELGIDAGRMTSKGCGESKPLDSNATIEGKANNRRVEFVKS